MFKLPKNFKIEHVGHGLHSITLGSAVIFFTGVFFGEYSITLYSEESKILYLSYIVRDDDEFKRDIEKFKACRDLEVKSYE